MHTFLNPPAKHLQYNLSKSFLKQERFVQPFILKYDHFFNSKEHHPYNTSLFNVDKTFVNFLIFVVQANAFFLLAGPITIEVLQCRPTVPNQWFKLIKIYIIVESIAEWDYNPIRIEIAQLLHVVIPPSKGSLLLRNLSHIDGNLVGLGRHLTDSFSFILYVTLIFRFELDGWMLID